MHEIGHNLGLSHAGESLEYDDVTGYMGYGSNRLDGPLKCFNPANSYKFEWYPEQVLSYDPLTNRKGYKQLYLNGVDDFNEGKANANSNTKRLIVLRLIQSNLEGDYYLGFNRKIGMNCETGEDANAILIVEKAKTTDVASDTKQRAEFKRSGDFYRIHDFTFAMIKSMGLSSGFTTGSPMESNCIACLEFFGDRKLE